MKLHDLLAGLLIAGTALAAPAQGVKAGDLAIDHPYARATAPGQPSGGAYLRVENRGARADRLVSASAGVSKTVELHRMQMEGDVMRMREIGGVDIPAKETVTLEPGGTHIMLLGLKAPLKEGQRFPMTLKFEKAGTVTVDVVVESVGAGPAKHDAKQ